MKVAVIFRNGRPIIELLRGRATLDDHRLAWCREREVEKHLRWWRSRYPRSRLEAVLVSPPQAKNPKRKARRSSKRDRWEGLRS